MASLIKRKSGKGTIYTIVYQYNGKRKWKSAGKIYSVAKIKLKELEYKLEMGQLEEQIKRDKPIPFAQFVKDRYLPFMETRRARNTFIYAVNSSNRLIDFFKDIPLASIDSKLIEDYIKQRKDHVKPRTVNIELGCLGHILKRAIEEQYLFKDNPIKKVEKLKVPRRHPRFLSREEMQKLWEHSSPWIRIFIVVASHSGMRAGEISNMQWHDIDWTRNLIKVKITKTNREREVPMDKVLVNTLKWFREYYIEFRRMLIMQRTQAQMTYVFCDIDGRKIASFHKAFNNAKRKAGITDITIHTLRHTYASHLANKGIPLLTIRDLLGHTDIKTTTIYSHLANEHLQSAVKQIDYGLNLNVLRNPC
ncbi:tyrosine-type recombinase/integrase [Candidatus Margulisiibacteriota bacterium]